MKEKIKKWIKEHGACDILLEKENIHLFNGGLFQDMNDDYAELAIMDLDETIEYLIKLKKFLNENNIKTDWRRKEGK